MANLRLKTRALNRDTPTRLFDEGKEGYPERMKRIIIAVLLVTSLVLAGSSASAAVSCNSVKTSILKIEKKILNEIKYFKSLPADLDGNIIIELGSADNARLEKFTKGTWVYDVWKSGTNNPKCFTNTQRIALRNPKFKIPESYLDWTFYPTLYELKLIFREKYQSVYKY